MALINIAANARDAMNGNGNLTITVGPRVVEIADDEFNEDETGHYLFVSIKDTGCGIDRDTLSRITEPFFTTKTEGKGTGLGLSMVDGFVKQSGGLLRITSEVDVGTTVIFYFRCDGDAIDNPLVQIDPKSMGRQGDREIILIVEDRADVADYVEEVLLELNYTVLKADNAHSALSILREDVNINLMFSDIVMPGNMKWSAIG